MYLSKTKPHCLILSAKHLSVPLSIFGYIAIASKADKNEMLTNQSKAGNGIQ